MFIVKFRERNILKRIKKLRSVDLFHDTKSIKKISSVGILTTENFFNVINLQQLTTDILHLRNPKIYSFRNYSEEQSHSNKYFTEKDFNWRGKIVDTSFKSFLDYPFDLLICYFEKPNLYVEYVAKASKAKYKIGFGGVLPDFFQFEVRTELRNSKIFFDETLGYLTILKKL